MPKKGINWFAIAGVVFLGLMLSAILLQADKPHSPGSTVVEFSKAYFRLDPYMSDYLSENVSSCQSPEEVAALFREKMATKAKDEGFPTGFKRYTLSHISTNTELIGKDHAKVALEAHKRMAINPLYAAVARLFCLGQNTPVEARFELVKEEGDWKVINTSLPLFKP